MFKNTSSLVLGVKWVSRGVIFRTYLVSAVENTQVKNPGVARITKWKFVSDKVIGSTQGSTFQRGNQSFEELSTKKVKVDLVAVSTARFEVRAPFDPKMATIMKKMNSVQFDTEDCIWSFDFSDYFELVAALREHCQLARLSLIPMFVLDILINKKHFKKLPEKMNWDSVDEKLRSALMPFQKEGVEFCTRRNGRAIIADDMGLGKTLQALAVMCCYRSDWPLLIVCPASVRYVWIGALTQWLSSLSLRRISCIMSGKDPINGDDDITIISYDLASRRKAELSRLKFKAVIMDESHYLKCYKTKRSKALKMIVKSAKRLLLLSGTPALSRPYEFYGQVELFHKIPFYEFGMRYCDGYKSRFGFDFRGASHLTELQCFLQEALMIRRMKSEVLDQLPTKRRQVVLVASGADDKARDPWMNDGIQENSAKLEDTKLKQFQQSGLFKLQGSIEFILELLLKTRKVVVFAHHTLVLDTLCVALEAKGKFVMSVGAAVSSLVKGGLLLCEGEDDDYQYTRIDGSTSPFVRQRYVDKFQYNEDCRVIVMSTTVGSSGIDLTAACDVVFAEMFWNPGTLIQAEDRAYRIGQAYPVNIYYMMCDYYADNIMWSMLQKKVAVLAKAGLSMEGFTEPKEDLLMNSEEKFSNNLEIDMESSWIHEETLQV